MSLRPPWAVALDPVSDRQTKDLVLYRSFVSPWPHSSTVSLEQMVLSMYLDGTTVRVRRNGELSHISEVVYLPEVLQLMVWPGTKPGVPRTPLQPASPRISSGKLS